jgi:hypothetical protein
MKVSSRLALLLAVGWAGSANAQLAVGNWTRTDSAGLGITLTVETCCNGGLRLTYHIPAMGDQPAATLTVDSPMDGTEVPVLLNGRPSGETMALKRIDASHMSGVVKMNGQLFVTSSSTLAADGKSATTESITQMPGGKTQKVIETWVKK